MSEYGSRKEHKLTVCLQLTLSTYGTLSYINNSTIKHTQRQQCDCMHIHLLTKYLRKMTNVYLKNVYVHELSILKHE